jgi:hypothetical protein
LELRIYPFILLCGGRKSLDTATSPPPPALPLSLGVVNGLLSDMRPRPPTSCSCHPHESVIQPVRLRVLDWLRIPPYTHLHKHHPPPTASIVADANCSNWAHESEHWSERLTICIITSSPSNERFNSKVAVSIAPKIATGEAHAIPKAASKWKGLREDHQHISLGQAVDQVELSSIY